MSVSLVGDYGDSSSSSEESEEEPEVETKPASAPKPKVALPSAADLFDSVGTSSFVSTAEADDAEVSPPLLKRKTGGSLEGKGSGERNDKRSKSGAKNDPPRAFVPPQMSRPNVVTEDAALWSTNASLKRQKQAAGGKAKGGVEGKKDSMTYKQREKAKRDKGQTSRGKSYVEEEKRLLREMGGAP